MIDRSYLPFESARGYVDRGMAKWMGFFISEHSTSLAKEEEEIDYSKQMKIEEMSLLLGQAYVHDLSILLYTNKREDPFLGEVYEVFHETLYFRTEGKMMKVKFDDLIRVKLLEGKYEEQNRTKQYSI